MPAIFKDVQDSDFIIRDIGENVNKGIENVTQSQQCKRWFGDWQNDPENAIKVVNADGTPKVMCYGTSAEFTAFDASKNKNNRVIAAQFVSQETIANTPHSPRSDNNIAQNGADVNSENEGVRYSLVEYTEHQKQNWKNSKRIVVFDNVEQLEQFIRDSVSDKTMDKKMYFGAIPPDLTQRIKEATGVNVENYNLSLGSYEIRKILKDHGDTSTEAFRGQRAVTTDDFSHIVDVVLNPIDIKLSPNTYNGKPAIIFTGNYNGRMNVVAVVSDKRLDLFVQTIYANAKKKTYPRRQVNKPLSIRPKRTAVWFPLIKV